MVSLLFATQITSLVAAVFGIVVSVVRIINSHFTFTEIIIPLYVLFFCCMLFLVELYIPPCFKYFGFLWKNWGKGATYLLLGFLFFSPSQALNIVVGVVFWILAVLYFALSILVNGIAKPLAQETISLSTSNADYYVEA